MTRCNSCNAVITKVDSDCYTCGEPVPGTAKLFWRSKPKKPAAPVTPLSNLLFMASLVLTLVSFLSSQRMPLPVSATLSGILLTARIVTDRRAAATREKRDGVPSRSREIPQDLFRRITLG
jgi:hypothetical protein